MKDIIVDKVEQNNGGYPYYHVHIICGDMKVKYEEEITEELAIKCGFRKTFEETLIINDSYPFYRNEWNDVMIYCAKIGKEAIEKYKKEMIYNKRDKLKEDLSKVIKEN